MIVDFQPLNLFWIHHVNLGNQFFWLIKKAHIYEYVLALFSFITNGRSTSTAKTASDRIIRCEFCRLSCGKQELVRPVTCVRQHCCTWMASAAFAMTVAYFFGLTTSFKGNGATVTMAEQNCGVTHRIFRPLCVFRSWGYSSDRIKANSIIKSGWIGNYNFWSLLYLRVCYWPKIASH